MFELYRAFRHTKAGRTPGSGICRQISLTNSIYKVMPVSSNNAFPMLLTNTSNPNNMVLGKLAPFLLLFPVPPTNWILWTSFYFFLHLSEIGHKHLLGHDDLPPLLDHTEFPISLLRPIWLAHSMSPSFQLTHLQKGMWIWISVCLWTCGTRFFCLRTAAIK